ncbi:recombinase family protein [Streptosporangium canum]|uniref:recombinase family protein n=1 Tax=Streptosporangium canum TaxID=324952 RepID=UPI00342D38B1
MLRYLVEHEIQMPVWARCGLDKGKLEWRQPNRETLQIMLHNPIYAGYYAYGRRRTDPWRKQFAMAGAYAWNISHHDFLMHPKPGFHYV